jgi:TolB-like protein
VVVLVFGNLRLDLDRRELRRADSIVPLSPQAFDLLAFLVQQRDRVVSKDDLLRSVWGGRIVSEAALTTRINAVRRAIGDDGTRQELVRTIRRRGLRFIADVIEVSECDPPASAIVPDGALGPADRPTLAVLPFRNLSGDAEQDYFAIGMADEITTAITRFSWLSVTARSLGVVTDGKAADARLLGCDLGARYLLEGSIKKAGNRVRITGELIDSETGVYIWRERFDGTLDDVFDFQDKVASGVAGAIEPRLRIAEIARASRKPTHNLDAYDVFLRAHAKCYRRTEQSLAEAIALARRALELDPDYAPAMAAISGVRCLQRNRHWIAEDGPEITEALDLARRAIASGTDNPDVLSSAGYALAFLGGENEAALCAIDRALTINPNFALAFAHRALVLIFLNHPDAAVVAAEQAIRLSPRDPRSFVFFQAVAFANLAVGRYEAGLPWAEEALRENAGLPAIRLKLSLCGHLGHADGASDCRLKLSKAGIPPTVPSVMRGIAKGVAPEIVARIVEGLRKADLPDMNHRSPSIIRSFSRTSR